MRDLKEHCGIFGIFNNKQASKYTYFGLYSLQHRGQEAAGIVTAQLGKQLFYHHRDFGLVTKVFEDQTILKDILKGNISVGHNRYSTAGDSGSKWNIQPLLGHFRGRTFALAHNGNLSNADILRKELREKGYEFDGNSDSEIIIHLLNDSKGLSLIPALKEILVKLEGAFSLLLMTNESLIAIRDSKGFRPLSFGRLNESICFASETCAFDLIGAEYAGEVLPGEIHVVDMLGHHVEEYNRRDRLSKCIFEYIYFSRPDSIVFGRYVDDVRRRFGKILARESPVPETGSVDIIVINVPDSSNTATLEYVKECQQNGFKCRMELGLIRNHYVGRTFIDPQENVRIDKVKLKFNPVRSLLKGRAVVIVDDSIVRGNTSIALMKMIKLCKPDSIHLRITSPPIVDACYYGMDFPRREKLIAFQKQGDVEKIREFLGVDSLAYLSVAGMFQAVDETFGNETYCSACFTKKHPFPVYRIEEASVQV